MELSLESSFGLPLGLMRLGLLPSFELGLFLGLPSFGLPSFGLPFGLLLELPLPSFFSLSVPSASFVFPLFLGGGGLRVPFDREGEGDLERERVREAGEVEVGPGLE